ncbi:hypothetical protein PENTCL1PPCAC_13294, partial [Pristionchus entomophagus]
CSNPCHLYVSITDQSRFYASNSLVQTPKGFASLESIADMRNTTNGQKLPLEISNRPTLTIENWNMNYVAGPLVLYIVNKQAPNFASAEVYEADGFFRKESKANALTVMSARPFSLQQKRKEKQRVFAHLTGFDTLVQDKDSCLTVYDLTGSPFPGFSMVINAPIVSLFYDLDKFNVSAGDLSAKIGISAVHTISK